MHVNMISINTTFYFKNWQKYWNFGLVNSATSIKKCSKLKLQVTISVYGLIKVKLQTHIWSRTQIFNFNHIYGNCSKTQYLQSPPPPLKKKMIPKSDYSCAYPHLESWGKPFFFFLYLMHIILVLKMTQKYKPNIFFIDIWGYGK